VGRLEGKVCLITGGGRGLGRAIALAYAAEGAAAVAITWSRDRDSAEATGHDIAETGATAHVLEMDVRSRSSVNAAIETLLHEEGRIDVLVNNAGINKQGPINTVTEADWDEVMAVNLRGPFSVSQQVLPVMIGQKGGRIINMASVAGLYGGPTTAHYAASKAGLISLTQVLARYGAEHNVLVNAIAPGIIETDMTREELRAGGGARVIGLTLLKRAGQVGDVASLAVLLASDEQGYMTGQTLSPNGGSHFTA
jgi:3-oxoacyl-[acyl-carrier protein] reductase